MRQTTAILMAAGALAPAMPAGAATLLHISSHLEKTAMASLDGGKPVSVTGAGSTNVPLTAGPHVLKVITATGFIYDTKLDLKPDGLMVWKGKGYWCVNLLDRSVDMYSKDECDEEVTDGG